MYKVIRYFTDLQDGNFPYSVGDVFPREGKIVTADRIKELSSDANMQGVALIEEVRGADETAISKTETVATTEEDSAVEDADNSAPVEDEPKKRGRKRKE